MKALCNLLSIISNPLKNLRWLGLRTQHTWSSVDLVHCLGEDGAWKYWSEYFLLTHFLPVSMTASTHVWFSKSAWSLFRGEHGKEHRKWPLMGCRTNHIFQIMRVESHGLPYRPFADGIARSMLCHFCPPAKRQKQYFLQQCPDLAPLRVCSGRARRAKTSLMFWARQKKKKKWLEWGSGHY